MSETVCDVLLTEAPLTLPREGAGAETGAILDFWGVVRGLEEGTTIEGIEYEAHRPMAEHQLRKIAHESADTFGLRKVIIYHRIGFVGVGEASLLVRITSGHRAEAFHASEWIVDELKRRVPIWKHPRKTASNGVRKPELVAAR